MKGRRTIDLLARDALDVDDPLLPVHLHNLPLPALQQPKATQAASFPSWHHY